jgi:hypothetical protein
MVGRHLVPLGRNRVRRPQAQVRRQDFVGLTRDGASDTVGQKTDGGQRSNRQRNRGQQHDDLAGA